MATNKVLVVEDDEALARAVAAVLQGGGFAVATAATCAEGLASLHSERPDLLLLDICLPDGDGWQVLAAARARGLLPAVPVVVISGHSIPRSRLREWGVFRFLAKPFDMAGLLETLREALGHKRRR